MKLVKDSVVQNLVALLGVFIIGYASIISIHFVFANIINGLDIKVKNEQARYQIGEYIVNEINTIEKQFYQMTMAFQIRELKPLQKKVTEEIKDIKHAINILEVGGTLEKHIQLNLVDVSKSIEYITYQPDTKLKYTYEAIDLIPKLDLLGKKIYEMDDITDLKHEILQAIDTKEAKKKHFKIKLFYKQIPAIFIRMKENASRLLYESKQELQTLQKNIEDQKAYYRSLEITVTIFVVLFIFLLGYIVIRQILQKSKELTKLTKEAKAAAKEAEIANETKSRFLANMSHEIRTPLNAIIGFSEILTKVDMKEEDKEKASIIVKSAKALLNIINDILDISKVESGKFEITPEKVDLKKSLSHIVELFAVNAKQKDIRLIYTYEEELTTYVDIDETRVKQVISNILSNAIKFTQEKESVTFHIKVLEKQDENVKVRFSIKDKGIGISPENQRKIFEPFSQADTSVSKQFGGTGLGLAISMKLISLMDSRIELISKEGEGSTFYFDLTLPYYKEEEEKRKPHAFYVCSIIDDEESLHKGLIPILHEFGAVYQANNAIESIDFIDLIFCFGDKKYFPKLLQVKERFNAPIVYVGKEEKIEEFSEFKKEISFYLDLPLLASKIYNIIAEACEIEKIDTYMDDETDFHGNILVAEDNSNNQLLIQLLLEGYGLDVTIVENGQLAVDMYKEKSFDLVFLDINMPVMDGITALKEIIKLETQSGTKVPKVALTANSLKGDKERFLNEGMDNYLAKPIDNTKLGEILALYLRDKNKKTHTIRPSIIDTEQIAKQFGVSTPTAKAMMEKLKKDLIKNIDALEEALSSNNMEEIKKLSKNLQTICINISFDEGSNIVQGLESSEDIESAQEKFNLLKEYLGDITKL